MVVENRSDIMNSSTVLVLSTGYEPLFKTSWKRAVTAVVCGRAEIVEQKAGFFIKTGSGKFPFPTKVRSNNLTGRVGANHNRSGTIINL